MAIDYGTRKIGLAFSDPLRSFVSRTTTLTYKSENKVIAEITEIIKTEEVSLIILGYPLNQDGSEGEMTEKVNTFQQKIKNQLEIEIILSDERYTSEMAENYLHQQGKKIKGHKEKIDAISAAIILDDYLRESGKI